MLFYLRLFHFLRSDSELTLHFLRSSQARDRHEPAAEGREPRRVQSIFALVLASCCVSIALSGCSSNYAVTSAGIGSFTATSDTVEFGAVAAGQAADSSVSVVNQGTSDIQVTSLQISGKSFALSSPISSPVTVSANGGSYSIPMQFTPKANGDYSGQLTISSTSTTSPSLKIHLHGKGTATSSSGSPALSSISCAQNSYTGAGSDACTATLNAAAGTGGLAVSLSSSNSAVSVPGTVTVAAGATSAGFTATVSPVTTAQSATLTGSAGGTTQTYSIGLGAYVPGLQLSATSLSFGSETINTTSAPQTVTLTSSGTAPLTINSATLSGSGFSASGTSFPVTLNPGQTATVTVVFDPTVTGTASGSITVSDNASPSTAAISLSGTGQAAAGVLSGLSCTTNTFTGSGTDTCTATLNAAAGTGGLAVSLSSSNSAVSVPGTVTVAAGATSAGFTATVSAVTTAQSATLTGSAGGITQTYGISLNAAVPGLSVGAATVTFGSVNLNTLATQSVILTSSGTAPVTISAGSVTGTGFTISGVSFPLSLNPGQTATLYIQFDPTVLGTATGTVTLTSNASPSTATIGLSGTGQAVSYQVTLTWSAPSSSTDPVAGYDIYRATGGSSSFQLLNPAIDVPMSYTDTTVQSGGSYSYYVESVDAAGNQSAPSNTYAVSIP